MDLAVHVRFRHVVEVDQREPAHAAARQGFDGPGAHAAHADDGHVGRADAGGTLHAIEALQAAEAALQVGVEGQGSLRPRGEARGNGCGGGMHRLRRLRLHMLLH